MRLWTRLALGLIFLGAWGCDARLNPNGRFHVGMCGIARTEELVGLKERGFDTFQTATDDTDLLGRMSKESHRLGMIMFLHPKHSRAKDFNGTRDPFLLDWAMSPNMPFETLATAIDKALRTEAKGKALWAVLDINNEPGRQPRSPQFNEIRLISYLAITHGAKGIFYSALQKPGGRTLLDFPEKFQSMYRVAWELNGLKPILEGGHPLPLPFRLKDGGLDAIAWRHHFRDYVIILNPRGNALLKFPEELLKSGWRPLFESQRDVKAFLTGSRGAWYLPPYRVLVLESQLKR